MADARRRPTRGFTLIELGVVMVIIGILISFILVAAQGGVRRAEERATQSLLVKLDAGMSDRIEAFLSLRPEMTIAHEVMARVYYDSGDLTKYVQGLQRAQVIAQYDMMRAEFPDTFYVPATTDANYNADYPLNFAAQPLVVTFTGGTAKQTKAAPYVLPLGRLEGKSTYDGGIGVYGATYSAAAGIYKNLGYLPAGYDGADNNNNGLIDDFGESGMTAADLAKRLAAHQPKTARSEMLYAILVEGQGPLGSVFDADDFTDREVRDTDGDGLPEFIDAWGEPLQYYRWPIMFHSDLQKGYYSAGSVPADPGPYLGAIEAREQNPLDPNQQLVAPSWWWSSSNAGKGASGMAAEAPLSGSAREFQAYFHSLVEPRSGPPATASLSFWDRGPTYFQRRAYFSKFLIASSGPDQELGIAQLPVTGLSPADLLIENQAAQATYNRTTDIYQTPLTNAANLQITSDLLEAGLDDVTNHSNLSAGGGVQ